VRERRRDLGAVALVLAAVLAVLALLRPVSRTTTSDLRGTAISDSGWFGDLVTIDSGGVSTVVSAAVPAFGWAVLGGVLLLAAAGVQRWRTGSASATTSAAAGWMMATGVLVALHTAARAQRVQDILGGVVAGELTLVASAGPWLLVASGGVAALGAAAPPREAWVRRSRAQTPPVVQWSSAPERQR